MKTHTLLGLAFGLAVLAPHPSAFAAGDGDVLIQVKNTIDAQQNTVSVLHRLAAPGGPASAPMVLTEEVLHLTQLANGRLVAVVPRPVTPFDPTTGLELWRIAIDGDMTKVGDIEPPSDLDGAQVALGFATDGAGRLFLLTRVPTSAFPPASYLRLVELDPATAEILHAVVVEEAIYDIIHAADGLWAMELGFPSFQLRHFDPDRGLLFGKPIATDDVVVDADSSGALWGFSEGVCSPPCPYVFRFDPATGSRYQHSELPPLTFGLHELAVERRCVETATTRCLLGGRFRANIDWRTNTGQNGAGRAAASHSADTAIFYFFEPANWEISVKVLDGCAINDHYWVFAAASTNVEYHLEVEDLETGEVRTYDNPLDHKAEAVNDIGAFACSP